jgi:hypothetical protein
MPVVSGGRHTPALYPAAMRTVLAVVVVVALAACGDDGAPSDPDAPPPPVPDAPPPDADTRDILERLQSLPGVTVYEDTSRYDPTLRYFVMEFTQDVDHTAPGGQTFSQNVTLLHRDVDQPMVAFKTGYANFYLDYPVELTQLLGSNQISIEHRFFATSRPSPADWTLLTIAQAAADEHHVVELLKTIYRGPWVRTGASKGGMTATYHRRFFPDDVVGTIPYVAPLSLGAPDLSYGPFVDAIGPAPCRNALRALQIELLDNRYPAMLAYAQDQAQTEGIVYGRVAIGPAVESAMTSIEWAFWQYYGVTFCSQVPVVGASDAAMWDFLDAVGSVTSSSDQSIAQFEAYYYQAEYELGYPGGTGAHLAGHTQFTDADYLGAWPEGVAVPTHLPFAMQDIDQWVQTDGDSLLFVYGEWDPWTGGVYTLGAATDSLLLTVPQATHGAGLVELEAADKAAAYARIESWVGVAPDESRLLKPTGLRRPQVPRVPPAMIRGMQLRRAAR